MSGVGQPYVCGNCGGTFEKTCSDEEALAEARSTWKPGSDGDIDQGEQVTVCDDCWRQIMEWAKSCAPETLR